MKETLLILFILLIGVIDATPPKNIPKRLMKQYTLEGKIPVVYIYLDNSYPTEKPLVYSFEEVEKFVGKAMNLDCNYYGLTDSYLYEAIDKYSHHFASKNVAIMGSVTPWYESITLSKNGVPFTIEYNKIISEDPRIHTYTVAEFNQNPRKFDAVLSISSFEHDGLGRYGDPLDPFGDLKAMQKCKNLLIDGGIMFLAVPIGPDTLCWNAHRIYGRIRLPLLLEGWEVIDSFGFDHTDFDNNTNKNGCHQPVFVLKPII